MPTDGVIIRPRILLVEDDAVLRAHLGETLSDEYAVETAGSGTEALRAVLRAAPDLIATDIVMPEMDGVELLKALRNTPSTQAIPVLLISGRAKDSQRIEGFQQGADGYLAKPYSELELRAVIGAMLKSARHRSEAARREALEEAARRALAERAALLESITDAFYALDRQWRFTYVNQRALKHFDRPLEDLIGRSLLEVFPAVCESAAYEHYQRAFARRAPAAFEMRSVITGRWVDIRVYPTGQGLAVHFRDITDQKETGRILQQVEADLRQTLDTAGVGLNRCTRDLRYVWANSAYATLVGVPLEQIVGSTVDRVLGSGTLALIWPYLERVLAGERVEYELERPAAGEPSRWLSVIYTPTTQPDGEVTGWVASVTDITRSRHAEEELREEAGTLERLGQMSQALMGAQLDTQRVLQIVTDTATEVLGAASGAFVGSGEDPGGEPYVLRALSGIPGEAAALPAVSQITAVLQPSFPKEGVVRSADITADPGGGRNPPDCGRPEERRAVRSYLAAPVRTAAGEGLGALVFGHPEPGIFDARAERRLRAIAAQAAVAFENARLHQAVRQELAQRKRVEAALSAADRQKDEFLAMLAHELRNPLAPISTASELLARTIDGQERSRFAIEAIKRQVGQLTRLVDDLLDVSRITRGRIELKMGVVELAAVITQAVETVDPQLRQKGHRLAVLAAGAAPLYVRGDCARLVQCVVNLLSNAIRYTAPNGDIRIEARADGERAIIEVCDNGAGIPPELMPRIFELFVQGDRSLDRAQGGLGIGLSVVKRLIAMHDGEVQARSPGVGLGSSFQIRLPLTARPAHERPEAPAASSERRRVLIVDDNHDAANTLAAMLDLDGHETRVAYGAPQALERVADFRPDIAILDIGLPEIDGYALARRLRALPELAGARLIAVTGYGQPEERQRALAAGFDEHLVKPVGMKALQSALAGGTPAG